MISNPYLWSVVIAFLVSIFIKALFASLHDHKLELHKGFSNGGMPSVHTALISSITSALLFFRGFDELFMLALVVSLIIASDAVKVRFNLGLQGEKLNTLLSEKEKIRVVKGHKLSQVLVGALVGVLSSLFVFLV